jgi:hypothetical protein
VNFKKKYAPILHLLPKGKAGRPSKDEQLERIRTADALMKKYKTGDLTIEVVPTKEPEVVETPVVEESEEAVIERMKTKFENITEYAHGIVSGAVRGLVVSGPGGIGKTETLVRIFEHAAEEKKIKFEHVKGGNVTPVHLYKLLYQNSQENNVVMLDDVDKVWNSEDSLNVLKAALDSSIRRTITWCSEAAILRRDEIPPFYPYNGSLVFVTNRNIIHEIEVGRGKDVDHLEAFVDRTAYISLRPDALTKRVYTAEELNGRRESYLWSEFMVKTNFILRQLGISDEDAEEVYAFTKEHYPTFRNVSIRTFLNVGRARLMSPTRWKELAIETLTA